VNLLPYAGQQIMLRFSFRTDGSVTYPGIYIDDVQVGESISVPLDITTTSISNALEGLPYSDGVAKTGGTTGAQWSIRRRHQHRLAQHRPEHRRALGHTGDGQPRSRHRDRPRRRAALAAYGGTQAIACVLSGDYPNGLAYATNHATSNLIDLTGTTAPQLSFWTWYDTESCCDGFNVKVSTDGVNFTLVTAVTPAYNATIASEQAWSGLSPGWVERVVDLSAYANSQIYLRIAFRTDGSVVNPGVFIDNVQIAD
jgi:bacillopeptidase F (M6 metalloprotease family)